MITRITVTAGEIWLELDKSEGIGLDELLKRLETRERPRDLLLMSFGWLVYQQHIKWIPGKDGGKLLFVSPETKDYVQREKSDQNHFAVNSS